VGESLEIARCKKNPMPKMKQAIIEAPPIAPIRSTIVTGGMGIQHSFDERYASPRSRRGMLHWKSGRPATPVHALVLPS